MLRISQGQKADQDCTLKLEGRIGGPWVHELKFICESLLNEGRALTLDLAGVSYVDAEGVSALMSFKSRGAILHNYSKFVGEQLKGPMAGS